jgi:hypothetical protein
MLGNNIDNELIGIFVELERPRVVNTVSSFFGVLGQKRVQYFLQE